MLALIFSKIGMSLISGVLDKFVAAFTAYENKQISIEQLKDQLYASMLDAIKDVEIAQADALTKTYASFMDTMKTSALMQRVWACAAISQLVVLVYHQLGIPAIVMFVRYYSENAHWNYPSSGTTVEWAYVLLGSLMGMAPMCLNSGLGAGSLIERVKAVIAAR